MDLWEKYQKVLDKNFSLNSCPVQIWADWIGDDGTRLIAKNYYPQYFIKSREVLIWNEKSCIYNNIFYPNTGSNLPCFGMDLMGFFDKKVIIVFDFQHPVENYFFSHPDLPKSTNEYRFFELGNHFSENIYIAKCTMQDVDKHIPMFTQYLTFYKNMVEYEKPLGKNLQYYSDFDSYMKRLDPVSGYLLNKFGKEKSEDLLNNFLFCYD